MSLSVSKLQQIDYYLEATTIGSESRQVYPIMDQAKGGGAAVVQWVIQRFGLAPRHESG